MPARPNHHQAPVVLALALLLCGANIHANGLVTEQTNLNLILRQLDAIDRLARSSQALPAEDGVRYTFDYPRFNAEIDLIRQGIKTYQAPARAQPRHPPELTGHYLREADRKP